jgi:class 3 adenylate cyclase
VFRGFKRIESVPIREIRGQTPPEALTMQPQTYRWTWDLRAPAAALWPLVSNTDRFNRDCGYPSVTVIPPAVREGSAPPIPTQPSRRLRAVAAGVVIEWDEFPFEWHEPRRFAVERNYHRGPLSRMVMSCDLEDLPGGGTRVTYAMILTPRNLLGRLTLPLVIGRQARATTERVFRRYDESALAGQRVSQLNRASPLATGGAGRLEAIGRALVQETGQAGDLVARLQGFVTTADDLAAARMRPYELADAWGTDRAATLRLCLHATRAGLLDFSWDLLCPHCRGAKSPQGSLGTVTAQGHCDSCNTDFTANFDQSVELSFSPNAAVRPVTRVDYCVGGPQLTPHIVAQQKLQPAERRSLPLRLAPGRYRVRAPGLAGQHAFRADPAAADAVAIDLGTSPLGEPAVAPGGTLTLANSTAAGQLAVVERVAWSDQCVTAAEVTSLQLFRDLFSREVLRAGEQISVGHMTIVFTDLKNSTQLYREIGDAPAFGRVLTHFEILKATVAAEGGCLIKTMGDAVMAAFPRPLAALRAVIEAQQWLADPRSRPLPDGVNVPPSSLQPLALKAGLSTGPCLAINQNDRLDYFGSTVNIGARLCALCSGSDLVLSQSTRADPEVAAWLAQSSAGVDVLPERATLKGFGSEAFEVCRLRLHLGFSKPPFGG